MVLCLLATDEEEEEGDVALQIHFTLIKAFCRENDINILRASNTRRLAEILSGGVAGAEPVDLHCVLVTVSVGARHAVAACWPTQLMLVSLRTRSRPRGRTPGRTRRWAR